MYFFKVTLVSYFVQKKLSGSSEYDAIFEKIDETFVDLLLTQWTKFLEKKVEVETGSKHLFLLEIKLFELLNFYLVHKKPTN